MADTGTTTYTTAELLDRANAGQPGSALTGRTLRYYASLGLIDPPITRQGQSARYTDRHLEQLDHVRRRRAAGRGLAEIAAEIAAASSSVAASTAATSTTAASDPATGSSAVPVPVAGGRDAVPEGLPMPGSSGVVEHPRPWPPQPVPVAAQIVRLGPGVEVLLTGPAIGDRALVERLAAAVAPLHRPLPLNGDARD